MKAWKELQKDLDARKYKSNPFQQKYIDLTTSSLASGNTSYEGISNLEYLSKSIRARSDIIGCQLAYLVKEAATVSEILIEVKATEVVGKSVMKKDSTLRNKEARFFVAESSVQESALLKKINEDPVGSGLEIGASTEYLWIDELLKSAEPSLMKRLCMPLCGTTDKSTEADCSSNSLQCSARVNDQMSHSSSDTLISSM